MKSVDKYFTNGQLPWLVQAYKSGQTMLMSILTKTWPSEYALSAAYVQALTDAFYDRSQLPDDCPPPDAPLSPRSRLSAADRERCLIALLASQRAGFALAVHVYIALMEGVFPEEIANVLLLAGMYSGADSFNSGLNVLGKTMDALEALAASNDRAQLQVEAVFKKLVAAFPT